MTGCTQRRRPATRALQATVRLPQLGTRPALAAQGSASKYLPSRVSHTGIRLTLSHAGPFRSSPAHRFGPLDGPIPNEVTENFAYLPFGGGRRKCIGDQFALFEALVALSMLMRRYEFRLDPTKPVGMTTGGWGCGCGSRDA